MKTDLQLKADISAELVWDPAVSTTGIGVAVKDGVVTLSGTLDSYAKAGITRSILRLPSDSRDVVLPLLDQYAKLIR